MTEILKGRLKRVWIQNFAVLTRFRQVHCRNYVVTTINPFQFELVEWNANMEDACRESLKTAVVENAVGRNDVSLTDQF